jgi:hypothetical protein
MASTSIFDHVGVDGSRVGQRVTDAGYAWHRVAENIAAGQTSLEEVIVDWLNSPSHCRALLDPRYEEFGLSVARVEDGLVGAAFGYHYSAYWTLVLGVPATPLESQEPRVHPRGTRRKGSAGSPIPSDTSRRQAQTAPCIWCTSY